jgi:hypothetical protein
MRWSFGNCVGVLVMCVLAFTVFCIVLFTYLLTYSMEQSPSWEANQWTLQLVKKFPAFMEPGSPAPYSQMPATCPHPVPTPSSPHDPSNFLKIHFHIILPSTSWSPQWPLSLKLPHQHPVHTSIRPHTRHMPCPSHLSRFYHPYNIGWGVQIIKLLTADFNWMCKIW